MALTRKKITVRGKSGKTFQRSVMVRAGEAVKRTAGRVGRFVNKHKGKIAAVAGAAALAGGLAYAHKKGHINLGGMASNARHAAGSIANAAKGAAGRAPGAVKRAAESVAAAHSRGVDKARSGAKAAAHPDRAGQGHSTGRVAQAVGAVRGYAQGVGAMNAARSVAGAAKSAGSAVAGAARSAASAASNSRVAKSARSAAANYKAGRTRKRTTLQLGSGN